MASIQKETKLGKRVAELDHRVAMIQKEQRRLNEILKVGNGWGSEVSNWFGCVVELTLRSKETIIGTFKWSDKYQVAVVPEGRRLDDPVIVNKGAIDTIELAFRKTRTELSDVG